MYQFTIPLVVAQIILAQARPLALPDYYRLDSVSAPALSPDGRQVAFVRTRIIDAENKRRSEIWVTGPDAGSPAIVSDPALSATKPRWSADGKLLAYEAAGAPWFVHMDGVDAKPYRIKGVEGTPVFSPDGKWIAFTRKVAPPKKDAAPSSEFDKLTDERFNGRIYDWMNFRFDGRGYLPDPWNCS